MKLEFLKKPMEYLRPVLREVRQVEETAEAIIPDSCPDVDEVLAAWGTACFRGKDLSEGLLTVSAGVSATAMAKPQGRETPEVVEVYIPMSVKIDSGVLHGGQFCRAEVSLRRLDGHLVNPRKVMVRATVSISVWVYGTEREEHLTDPAVSGIQCLKKTAPVRCLRYMGEKNYTLEDQIALTPEGNGQTICGLLLHIRHTDARLTGTRAVLKGEVSLQVLYLDAAGALKNGSGQVNFSQYVDLGDCGEKDELQLQTVLTGADVSFSGDGESLSVILQLNTCAEVWGTTEIGYVGDMYSLSGMVKPELVQRSYDSLVDRQLFSPAGHGVLDGIHGNVIFANCISGEPTRQHTGEQVSVVQPVSVQILYRDENDALCGAVVRVDLRASTSAAENARFEISGGGFRAVSGPDGSLNVKVSGDLEISTFCELRFQEILGAELEEEGASLGGPGLIIRRPKMGETMWDIAKAFRTTPETIAAANGLEGDQVPEKLLLIPRSR